MNILVLGDIVGGAGCEFLRKKLPAFKRLKAIDVCIANGENSAQGNGITPFSAEHLFASGVDFITTGNHVYRRAEVYDLLSQSLSIIRPANFRTENPGRGFGYIEKGALRVAVINIMGTVYMDALENPFDCADRILKQLDPSVKTVLVDFHAEATGEKRALGFWLDGRVSAIFGTHTHVQTADECILPSGTAYITDIGMTGVVNSVLGVKPELAIEKMRTNMPVRFDNPEGECKMEGCIFEIDNKTGRAKSVERVSVY